MKKCGQGAKEWLKGPVFRNQSKDWPLREQIGVVELRYSDNIQHRPATISGRGAIPLLESKLARNIFYGAIGARRFRGG